MRSTRRARPSTCSLMFPDSDAVVPEGRPVHHRLVRPDRDRVDPAVVDSRHARDDRYLDTRSRSRASSTTTWSSGAGSATPTRTRCSRSSPPTRSATRATASGRTRVRRAVHAAERGADGATSARPTSTEMQQIFYDDAPYLILYYDSELHAYRTDKFSNWQTSRPTPAARRCSCTARSATRSCSWPRRRRHRRRPRHRAPCRASAGASASGHRRRRRRDVRVDREQQQLTAPPRDRARRSSARCGRPADPRADGPRPKTSSRGRPRGMNEPIGEPPQAAPLDVGVDPRWARATSLRRSSGDRTIFMIVIINFVLFRAMPGSPERILVRNPNVTPECSRRPASAGASTSRSSPTSWSATSRRPCRAISGSRSVSAASP